ncbi:MAG: GIY-YIG nuclease family protein, partial [Bacteroidales bacterium]
NIPVNGRHRAAGDALATVKLFELLLKTDPTLAGLKSGKFFNINTSIIKNLPDATGVYYFHNQQGDIIYIGKSRNIRTRVLSHFNNEKTSRAIKMVDEIFDITYELTGSDLIAQLLESDEIKNHKPKYNRRQRRKTNHYGIYSYRNEFGYVCFKIDKIGEDLPLISFNSAREARERFFLLSEKHQLCQKLCGLYETGGPCFYYQLQQCKGACIQKEPAHDYNHRVNELIKQLSYDFQSFFIIDQGRTGVEKCVVKIENGKYFGFGYIDHDLINNDTEILSDVIKKYPDNKDVQQIIRTYLKQYSVEKIITA